MKSGVPVKPMNEAMVLLEYLSQGRARAGAWRLLIGDAIADKSAPDLVVQILTVGHDNEREVPRHHASHFFRKERHRVGLAAPLGVPEHAEPAEVRVRSSYQEQKVVRVVFGKELSGIFHRADASLRR